MKVVVVTIPKEVVEVAGIKEEETIRIELEKQDKIRWCPKRDREIQSQRKDGSSRRVIHILGMMCAKPPIPMH